jgi:hypothetical protein
VQSAVALCGTLVLSACAAKYTQVQPRLSLAPYGRIALVTFASQQTNGRLSSLATQRFAEELLASQPGVELLELNAADSTLGRLPADGDAVAFAQALGRAKEVPAVFVGYLTVTGMKPRGGLSAASVDLRAAVGAELTVRLLSTQSGATVWRSSAVAKRTVGKLAIGNGRPAVAVRDPNDMYGQVVRELVGEVTRDLRSTWVKR